MSIRRETMPKEIKPKPKKKMGRPSSYTKEKGNRICALIEQGSSLRAIARMEGMPSQETLRKWLCERDDFLEQYTRAREHQADSIFEEILEIADDGSNDYMQNDDDKIVLNSEHVQRSRLRVDSRKWMLARMSPRKYGDKVDVTANVTVSHEDALKELK